MILHFIRHGDTLQSVANQINLENPLYIKEFHNQKCAREDYILDDLVVGKKLFLPDNQTIQKYNAKNDAPFKSPEQNPVINFTPEEFNSRYKINITESSADKRATFKKNSFSYNISLKWIENELNEHVFHLSKSDFSNINDTKIGDLAIACIQSINPIEIRTNFKGEMVRINLLEETAKNFPRIKEKLLDQFPDQYAKIYIEEFEFAVLNSEVFQKKMKEDWFIKTYFANIRNEFKNGKSNVRLYLDGKNSLTDIQQTGLISENYDIILTQSFAGNQPENSAVFTGNYTLSQQQGTIKSLNIYYSYSEYNIIYSIDFQVNEIV
ncbi:hypothetical protein K0U91_02365 [Chryseobacterium chendengshani]|uniref:hypothetical protein n=1 Tax=Chryseobacterium sp. LJ668 TaxID=2864040 RepID=UPI001C6938D0|nr:hypothetical protein [Chryseobacterium sp. LJ668]MBW8524062.1 hypothetical protein [Chryseobacterium sp. LJ668]QYK16998.1 hypothetical protein K0U91_02365 [Chryseobacterium sp. LJ668]